MANLYIVHNCRESKLVNALNESGVEFYLTRLRKRFAIVSKEDIVEVLSADPTIKVESFNYDKIPKPDESKNETWRMHFVNSRLPNLPCRSDIECFFQSRAKMLGHEGMFKFFWTKEYMNLSFVDGIDDDTKLKARALLDPFFPKWFTEHK